MLTLQEVPDVPDVGDSYVFPNLNRDAARERRATAGAG